MNYGQYFHLIDAINKNVNLLPPSKKLRNYSPSQTFLNRLHLVLLTDRKSNCWAELVSCLKAIVDEANKIKMEM